MIQVSRPTPGIIRRASNCDSGKFPIISNVIRGRVHALVRRRSASVRAPV
jgi:hypothetical protein